MSDCEEATEQQQSGITDLPPEPEQVREALQELESLAPLVRPRRREPVMVRRMLSVDRAEESPEYIEDF